MRTIVKTVKDLTPYEYKACHSLNRRANGLMQGELEIQRSKIQPGPGPWQPGESYAIMVWDGNVLLGWCLAFNRWAKTSSTWDTYYYVRATHRRHGIGTRLVNATTKRFPIVRVYPWGEADNPSKPFFADVMKKKKNVTRGR